MMVPRFDIVPIPEHLRHNMAPGSILEFPWEVARGMYDFRADDVVGKIAPRPLLLIHPAKDSVTPTRESVELFLRAGMPAELHLFVDLDHFRAVNEKYGNRVGDQVLQKIADIVRTALRKEDMLVRYGGEELLVMLPDVPGPGAVVVAGRIRKAVEAETMRVEGNDIPMTVSVGVSARLDEGPESIENLLARADEALALAKQRGRNRVVALSLGRSIAA